MALSKRLAQQLAKEARLLDGVQVLGLAREGPGYALVVQTKDGRVRVPSRDSFSTLERKAGVVHGHAWSKLNKCSLCRETLKAPDGHYHEQAHNHVVEAVCCRCIKEAGGICRPRVTRGEPVRVTVQPEIEAALREEARQRKLASRARRQQRKALEKRELEEAAALAAAQLPAPEPRRRKRRRRSLTTLEASR